MTEFEDLELNKDVASMEEDEAKKTLSEFMEAHKTNRTAYNELQGEIDEIESEYSEKLEEKEELISEFKQDRAEVAAEHVEMPASLLAERFEYSEIEQIIEEAEEYSEQVEDEEEPEDDAQDKLTTFSDKPEKGQTESGGADYTAARNKLADHGFPGGE